MPLSGWQDGHDREGDGMELEEFALGESALGTASGVGEGIGLGGGRGLKAAASTAASNLRRNVRSMLNAQQQQQQQQVRTSWLETRHWRWRPYCGWSDAYCWMWTAVRYLLRRAIGVLCPMRF